MKQGHQLFLKANLAVFMAELFNALNINSQKYLLPEWCSPVSMFLLRAGFATMLFWIISLLSSKKTRKQTIPFADIIKMIFAGVLFLSGYIAFYLFGVELSSSVDSSLLFTTMPIFVFILSYLIFNESISKRKILGLLTGIAGTIWIVIEQDIHHSADHNTILGNIFCLISALCYALYLITNKQFVKRYGIITMLKWMFTGAFMVASVLSYFYGFDAKVLSKQTEVFPVLTFVFVLIFPTFLTYLLLPYGLKRLNTTTVSIYDYEVPIVATIVAVIFMKEAISLQQILSAGLIFIGVFLVSSEKQE